ncbi:hypothetical protein ONS95_014301 [Cadophora gregata]|uniref:uncharacterized protein n=1 Tax=Cadophora gregata TaxID=51156 RepID=UPI0026DC0C2F|nr:uncharacterized protein ONS95_014301 [Cadophora gregata]KAK0114062.1 hypothetical protein ONS96_014908 [Cadophora gregata f. sp. sojae]KAK0114821.1 hypothetical protein ONS95_014301 [Cadophora gregata]
MDIHDELPASLEDLPASLTRTCSIPDLTKLFKKPRSTQSQSRADSRQSANSFSDNSQILYMAESKKPKSRKGRQSLSSIGNGVNRRFDGSLDERECTHDAGSLSWDVIDQEIFEWQYVCQTGRPYWWSPDSKYTRLKKYQPRLMNEPSPRFWMRELDGRPKPAYAEKRRAVSDNYFCDPKAINDLAHLVAIQLLGACFTLPPDHILGVPSPNYTIDNTRVGLPDPRMISSLRMHTQFRYSPSFGHQARNTSPVQAWPRSLGRPSFGFPSPIADIGTAANRRGERRRTLNVTDGSGSVGSFDSDVDQFAQSCSSNDGLDHTESTKVHRSKGASYPAQTHMGPSNTTDPVPGHARRRVSRRRKDEEIKGSPEAVPKTNYRLEPVIRSEPHHVFIQPVRELVVKRWANFKRRLSGSLHSALPARNSDDRESSSDVGSPAMSNDGKIRRLRAQERGEIHSSDVETTQHFNTPTSGILATHEGVRTPDRIHEATIRLSNPSIAEAALTAAEGRISQSPTSFRSRKHVSPSESSLHPLGYHDYTAGQTLPTQSRPVFPLYSPARFNPPFTSKSFSSRRRPNREQRKSNLSEMFTADDVPGSGAVDLAGRGISRAPTTANLMPSEETKQVIDITTASVVLFRKDPVVSFRPRMGRTSTSGTQIFTPGDNSIELDGLPVGPPEETWMRHGRRERTYL